ncbi:hypothetical protein L596_022889 [Steinernema carpocapsae]|uniref:Uncharacterized protein n=1 Tax=Steinernema carpocapsae TaxID=34508 RepID=A0A4U5MBX7_STECR|nr:hypothetical protein L596_022889 [Steinernema carpocapsae]
MVLKLRLFSRLQSLWAAILVPSAPSFDGQGPRNLRLFRGDSASIHSKQDAMIESGFNLFPVVSKAHLDNATSDYFWLGRSDLNDNDTCKWTD